MMKYYNCILCNVRTKPSNRRSINTTVKKYLNKNFFISTITDDDKLCNKCMHNFYLTDRKAPSPTQCADDSDPDYDVPLKKSKTDASPPSVCLNIPCTSKSHASCFVCKHRNTKLSVLSQDARFKAFIDGNILIPAGARCCTHHLGNNKELKAESFTIINTQIGTSTNRTFLVQLLSHLRETCMKQQNRIDFEQVTDDGCKNLTGLSLLQFQDLCSYITPNVKKTPSRTPENSIGIFLMKLKCALGNKLLSTLFKISVSSVRRAIHTVRQALIRSFVPLFLGFESLQRDDIIHKHTRPLAKRLLDAADESVILVLDGTYIYIQKSNNFAFQRGSYSVHKNRPLVKPMVVVTTSGYFVTVHGPYLAKNNDASILKHMLERNLEDMKSFIHEDDIFVVDRGCRDALDMLEKLGIKAAMPAFMKKGEKQMSDEDANTSRMVTKIRWVVESANARIKNFKYLACVLPTSQVPYIGEYVKIVCAISNKYFPPLSNPLNPEDEQLANEMISRASEVNTLKEYVKANHLERRSAKWEKIEDLDIQFPSMNEEQLRTLTLGVYQLKLCPSYIQEYVDKESAVYLHKEERNLLRVKIQSRHVSSKQYLVWIKYSDTDIQSWYCTCRAGSRVVGVCAHVAAIIWYLCGARESRQAYGVRDWSVYLSDANDLPPTIDSSESETESVASVIEE